MARVKKLEESIKRIYKTLEGQEREQDSLLLLSREIVRCCAVAIKAVHAGDFKAAEKEASKAEKLVQTVRKADKGMAYVATQSYQEFAELRILLAVVEGKEVPTYEELRIPFEPYLLGLMDAVGEFRREMLEALKKNKRKKAEECFEAMNSVYESVLPLRFSNSLLPNFRKKQDVARMQLEQARSELLR